MMRPANAVRQAASPRWCPKGLLPLRDERTIGGGGIGDMLYFEVLVILGLVLLNGFFAMSELAVVSSRKIRLKTMVRAGVPGARSALALAEAPGTFLPTVQVGITLVGVFAGAFSGATVANKLAASLSEIPALQPFSHSIAIAIVVAAITYLSLIVGELVPKQIALYNAEGIATRVARPLRWLSRIASPIVWLLRVSSEGLLALLGLHRPPRQTVTAEEVRALVAEGMEAGVFERSEREIIDRALRLDDRSVQTIMTPRHEIAWLDVNDDSAEIARKIRASGHSRYPVCRSSPDEVLGIVLVRDLLAEVLEGKKVDLNAVLRPAPAIHESTTALEALGLVRNAAVHVALVVDEYGSLQGIATMKDITEAIVGTIRETEQPEHPDCVQREDGSWLVDGLMPIPEVKPAIGLPDIPEDRGFHTLAGFVMWQLGRVPKVADSFTWQGWRFEVVDMDGRRIDKVAISPPGQLDSSIE
jgi:putative hemolysin